MKTLKLISMTAAAAVLFVSLATPSHAASVLKEILSSGVLKAGTTGDWNPMSVKDPATNSYKGYDIDVFTELAKDMGVKLELVPTDWKTLVSGVAAGNYYISGSASISPARMKAAGYTSSYIAVEIFPCTMEENAGRFDSWESINKPGVKVAATLGTLFEKWIKDWFPKADHVIVEAPALQHMEVISGRADVFVTSNIEGATLTKKFSKMRAIPVTTPRNPSPIAMLLPQDDQVWINYVNSWITLKQTRGFFAANAKKWGLQ